MYKKSKNLADMLPRSFKAAKCKTSLKLVISRIKLMKNRKEIQVKQMRRDLAQLLEAGQDQTARIRVEHVIREEKAMSAYELIDIYCELITARLPIIESQKNCPIDLKEAISSVIFASPRCADIPELMDVRKQFVAKYGKEFVTSALEVRPECGVSRMLIDKLSARAPDVETKIKVLTSIANEHNVKWDSKSFEEHILQPNDDLLGGPNSFSSANQMPKEPSNANFPATPSRTNEPSRTMFPDDVPHEATHLDASGPTINASSNAPTFTHSNSRVSDIRESRSSQREDTSVYWGENASSNSWNQKMEFKDAASAAQAAAESAEMASLAARAAAQVATLRNAPYDITNETEKLETPRVKSEHITKATETMQSKEMLQRRKIKKEDTKIDEVMLASSARADIKTYDDHARNARTHSHSPSDTNEISSGDGFLDVNQKVNGRKYGHPQQSFSTVEKLEQYDTGNKSEITHSAHGIINEGYDNSAGTNTFDDDNLWGADDWEHANNGDESRIGVRRRSFGSRSAAVFDDYGDTDDQLAFKSYETTNILDPFSSHQVEEHPSFWRSEEQFNFNRQGSESLFKDSSQLPSVREYHSADEKGDKSPQYKDNAQAAFDDDGVSSEGEDVIDKIMCEEAVGTSCEGAVGTGNLFYDQRNSSKGMLPVGSGRESNKPFSFEEKEVENASDNFLLSSPCYDSEKKYGAEMGSSDDQQRRSSTSDFSHSQSIPNENVLQDSNHLEAMDEKLDSRCPSRVPSLGAESVTSFKLTSLHLNASEPASSSNTSYGHREGLKLGILTGGFKNKGFPHPSYVKDPLPNASIPSRPFSVDQPPIDRQEKTSTTSEALYQERSDREPLNIYPSTLSIQSDIDKAEGLHYSAGRRGNKGESSSAFDRPEVDVSTVKKPSRTNKASQFRKPLDYFDEDVDDLEPPNVTGSRGNVNVRLSRRTRDLPADTKRGNFLRSTGQSNATSEIKRESSNTNSAAESWNTVKQGIHLERRESSESLQPNLSPECPSEAPPKVESSTSKENIKSVQVNSAQPGASANTGIPKTSSSTEGLPTRQNSIKHASHVHPKLPDYESLAAHFQSLRANRR